MGDLGPLFAFIANFEGLIVGSGLGATLPKEVYQINTTYGISKKLLFGMSGSLKRSYR
jgi:hypothetical protein